MNPVLADVIGLAGSALMVVAYAYANMTHALNYVWFNLMNLVGSLMLMSSLLVHFNIASMALEIVWAVVAALGLGKAIWRRPAR